MERLVGGAGDHDLVLRGVVADELVVGDVAAVDVAVDDSGCLGELPRVVLTGGLGGVEGVAHHRPEVVPRETAALDAEGEAVPTSVDVDAVATSPGEQRRDLKAAIVDGTLECRDLAANPVGDVVEHGERTAEAFANSAVLQREAAVLEVQDVGERPGGTVNRALRNVVRLPDLFPVLTVRPITSRRSIGRSLENRPDLYGL